VCRFSIGSRGFPGKRIPARAEEMAMASLWDDVKNAIVDGYVYATDKAEELTQISRARVEILRLNRKIAHTMSEIGGRAFDLFDEGEENSMASDEHIRSRVEAIRGYRKEISSWEREIERARAERERKASSE
jgi:hypothetical protein